MNGLVMSTLALTQPRVTEPALRDARAWELLTQILDGKLSLQTACERHHVRREDMQEWLRCFHRSALIAFDQQLREALIRQGATAEALGGHELSLSLTDVSIVDWIQAIQQCAKHAVITVMHDTRESRLWCSKGVLIDAESGPLSGEAAVYRIAGLEQGQVVTELRLVSRERTIRTSTQGLLLEAARRKDEGAVLRHRIGDLDRHYIAANGGLAQHSLNAAEAATLRRFAGARRLSDVMEQSELGDIETLAALESLIRAGVLVETLQVVKPEPASKGASGEAAANRASFLPVSFAWPPREREPRQQSARWLASTVVLTLVVSVAAWVGARGSVVGAAAAPSAAAPPTPSVAPIPRSPAPEESYTVAIQAHPAGATLQVDGHDLGTSFWQSRLPRDGAPHEIRVTAPGFVPERIVFVDTPPPADVHLDPLSPPTPTLQVANAEPSAPAAASQTVAPHPRRRATAARQSRDSAAPGAVSGLSLRPSPDLQTSRKTKPRVQIIDDEPVAAERY
jgi:hypothetical protein